MELPSVQLWKDLSVDRWCHNGRIRSQREADLGKQEAEE